MSKTNETTTGAGPTAGPWHRCGIDGAGHEWVSAGGPVPIAHIYPQGAAEENRRVVTANARLIAAAPDLLAALKTAEAWIDQQGELPGCRPAANAALAVVRDAIRDAEGRRA